LKIAHSSALPRETKSKESYLHFSRCSCSLCSSQRSRRDRCRSRGCGTCTSGNARRMPGLDRSHTPVLPCEETTLGPLPQNRAVNTRLNGVRWCRCRPGHASVTGVCIGVGRNPSGRVTSVDVEHSWHSENECLGPRQCCSLERR